MVKVTSIVLASFAIAPLVFATANPADSTTAPAARSIDNPDLEARAPAPQPFGKWLRKARGLLRNRWISKAIPIVTTAAKFVARDENGDLYIRDVDVSELSERDLEDLDLILDARDFEDFEDLDTREPRRKFGGALRKLKSAARRARPLMKYAKFVHPGAAPLAALAGREFDEDELDARDYEDLIDLLEREFEDDLDLDAREPWWGSDLVNRLRGYHRKGANVLKQVNDVNSAITKVGLREFDEDLDLEERDFDDDEFELEAREPSWASNLWKKARRVHHQGTSVLGRVNDANRMLNQIGLREFEDEMEERSFDDLDALD